MNKRARDERSRLNARIAPGKRAAPQAVPYQERTSWKRPAIIAFASLGLVAGSIWLLTQDLDQLDSITIVGDNETAAVTDATATPRPTPRATEAPDEEPDDDTRPRQALDLEQFTRDIEATPTPRPVVELDLPEGAVPIPTPIPALPQLEPHPRVPTIPTLRPSTPAPRPPPAPAQRAPAPAPAPRPSPFNAVPAPQPRPAPPPPPPPPPPPRVVVIVPAPAPVAPAPASSGGCTAVVVSYDLNRDGVADGSLPTPCSPCPSGRLPQLLPGDSMFDC